MKKYIYIGLVIVLILVSVVAYFSVDTMPRQVKGTLIIYNPSNGVSELDGKGFEPSIWYLVPEGVEFPGTSDIDLKLEITDKSLCVMPANQFSTEQEQSCLSGEKFKWGYGDRVSVAGEKKGNVVSVTRMEILSAYK